MNNQVNMDLLAEYAKKFVQPTSLLQVSNVMLTHPQGI